MSFISWESVKNFYQYYCYSNKEFLNNIDKIPLSDYDTTTVKPTNTIINKDMIESTNQYNELLNLYKQNKLVSLRLGCVESAFIIKYLFNFELSSHMLWENNNIDKYMRQNAGFYYKDNNRKKEICDWWCNETIEILKTSTLVSCYCFLNFDLILWSLFNFKKKFYNYGIYLNTILQNSEGKKILYIGGNVDSIRAGYERGLQNVWSFPISNFSMYYLKTPQTTEGCPYPHTSIKETCEHLIKNIDENYADFDTAIFSCGAYGPPLINMLHKKYPNKNLIYLGSLCLTMFGIKMSNEDITPGKENWIKIVESIPEGAENHPEPKYWKKD